MKHDVIEGYFTHWETKLTIYSLRESWTAGTELQNVSITNSLPFLNLHWSFLGKAWNFFL